MKRLFALIAMMLVVFGTLYTDAQAEKEDLNAPPGWLVVPEGYTALMNAKSLHGWQGRFADIESVKKMSADERKNAQAEADKAMKENWMVSEEGTLIFDGRGQGISTIKHYRHFDLMFQWKIKPRGSTGIYLRGYPQVQLWDTRMMEVGSGGLFNNKGEGKTPLERADKNTGLWNQARVRMLEDRVWVWMNDKLVVDGARLENFYNREGKIAESGPIEIENDDNTLYFRNMFIREISDEEAKNELKQYAAFKSKKQAEDEHVIHLFDGSSLEYFTFKPDGWKIENDTLVLNPEGGYLWTREKYENFVLELEYQVTEGCNSGVFFRADPVNPVQGGFEIQIMDSYGDDEPGKHDDGALYDLVAPKQIVSRKPGEWNTFKLVCDGPKIILTVNQHKLVDVNIDEWDTAGKNPDGSANKFKTIVKDLPRKNHIGFQDHGKPVAYRNIRLTILK